MELTLRQIVGRLGGEAVGEPAAPLTGVATLDSAGPRDIAFLANPRYRAKLATTRAGAVILGKANMHELAAGITTISSLGGQTRNPYDPRRCPGGSSGGTAAAVAATFAAVGWGSDTCGSIRIPAAFNSLFGLRPTEGLVSRAGIVPLSHTQDVGGPLARTMTDLAIALDATIGPDPQDSVTRVLQGRALPYFEDSLRADALRGGLGDRGAMWLGNVLGARRTHRHDRAACGFAVESPARTAARATIGTRVKRWHA